jgi:putative oxidoreductase
MLSGLSKKGQERSFSPRAVLAGSYATLISRLILGATFLIAGALKALNPGGLAASIRTYELGLPEGFVTVAAHSLPYLEILLGFYLLAGLFTRISAWATNTIMAIFVIALLQGALRGLQIDCGCFGSAAGGAKPGSLWLDALRDLGLLVLGLHIALAPIGRFSVDALLRRRGHPEGESYEV